jgi:hypothetical protein
MSASSSASVTVHHAGSAPKVPLLAGRITRAVIFAANIVPAVDRRLSVRR